MVRTIVVTGASSGLGRATALALARRGEQLVISARSAEVLEEVAAECRALGAVVVVKPADVRIEEEVRAVLASAVQHFGSVDVWINNAGTTLFAPLEQGDFAAHRNVIETNLFGAIHGARAVLPLFLERRRGILINVGSILSSIGQAFVPAYVISKFGVRGLSEALRVECADHPDIHVCTLLPYAIATPHFENGANWLGRKAHPVPPVLDPEHVASVLVSLIDRPRRVRHVPRIACLGLALHAVIPRRVERTLLEVLRRWHLGEAEAPSEGNLQEPRADHAAVHGKRPPLVGSAQLLTWAFFRMLFGSPSKGFGRA